jgi:hypothetical protein
MNFNVPDDELAGLIEQPESFLPWTNDGRGRVNPVQRRQPVQPQVNPFIINNRTPGAMPSNGGRKKKRRSKHSKKYKNKNYKNKNRKHQTRKTRRVMKKRK